MASAPTTGLRPPPSARPTHAVPRPAVVGGVALVLMAAVACVAGLLSPSLYGDESAWGAAAMRGGDLATLAVVVPLLAIGVVRGVRGSLTWQLVWAGSLAYLVYDYAYYVFGARFNATFLLHVLVLATAAWTLVCLLPLLRDRVVAPAPHRRAAMRRVAAVLGLTAAVLGGLWTWAILTQALTGRLPDDPAPESGLHTVYAVDLSVFVSSLAVAAVLAWCGTRWGAVGSAVMALSGGLYLINLAAAQVFQFSADVVASPVSPVTAALVVAFAASAVSAVRTCTATADEGVRP